MTNLISDVNVCCLIPDTIEYKTDVTASNELNRHAVANRKLKTGEVILRNAPMAVSLHHHHRHDDNNIQRRCAHCLEGSIGGVKLSRCGRCRSIFYCSRNCQKADFPGHKMECSYFTSPAFLKRSGDLQYDRIIAEICLLVRTYALFCGKTTKHSCTQTRNGNTHVNECGKEHLFSLMPSSGLLDPVDLRIVEEATNAVCPKTETQIQLQKQQVRDTMKSLLRRFRVNNFGITDSLLRVIGSAIYPLGALLNHSCRPNCLLRYRFRSQAKPVLEIAVCRDVEKGEELTHSYIELLESKSVRQDHLASSYGFTCNCLRCAFEHQANEPSLTFRDIISTQQLQEPETVRDWLEYYNPLGAKTIPLEMLVSKKTILSDGADPIQLKQAVEGYRYESKQGFISDNLHVELVAQSNIVHAFRQLLLVEQDKEQNTSLELYKARGDYLGTLIIANKIEDAITECEYVVLYLASMLSNENINCHNHPILGLQLFTLGDLYQSMVEKNTTKGNYYNHLARHTFSWARHILLISHGRESQMVHLLNEKLS